MPAPTSVPLTREGVVGVSAESPSVMLAASLPVLCLRREATEAGEARPGPEASVPRSCNPRQQLVVVASSVCATASSTNLLLRLTLPTTNKTLHLHSGGGLQG